MKISTDKIERNFGVILIRRGKAPYLFRMSCAPRWLRVQFEKREKTTPVLQPMHEMAMSSSLSYGKQLFRIFPLIFWLALKFLFVCKRIWRRLIPCLPLIKILDAGWCDQEVPRKGTLRWYDGNCKQLSYRGADPGGGIFFHIYTKALFVSYLKTGCRGRKVKVHSTTPKDTAGSLTLYNFYP